MKTKLINCESDPNSWLETGVQRGFTGRWLRCYAATATATVAATVVATATLVCFGLLVGGVVEGERERIREQLWERQ